MQKRIVVAAVIAVTACVVSPARAQSESRPWLDDFTKLKRELTVGYANLEFARETGRVNLIELNRETKEQLRTAGSKAAARKALGRFVAAFRDPHFLVERVTGPPAESDGGPSGPGWKPDAKWSTSAALAKLGYRKRTLGFRLTVEGQAGYEKITENPDNPFHAGVLPVGDRRFGFLRIAHFGEDGYAPVAGRLWDDFREQIGEGCDVGCLWGFARQVSEQLLADVAERVRQLDALGIDALVVDVTGNGGGTDWAAAVPYILTRSPLECNASAFVRHEHWSNQLTAARERIRGDLENGELKPSLRGILSEAQTRYTELLDQSRESCDWSAVWEDPEFASDCSPLVRPRNCATTRGATLDELRELDSASLLDGSLRFDFERGVYDGPLIVVTDGGSASATEQFVALLQANKAATIVGSRTTGAGCGYTGRGISTYLENTALLVSMPDCVRFNGQGINEMAGIEPDIPIDWKKGAGGAGTQKLVEALRGIDLPGKP